MEKRREFTQINQPSLFSVRYLEMKSNYSNSFYLHLPFTLQNILWIAVLGLLALIPTLFKKKIEEFDSKKSAEAQKSKWKHAFYFLLFSK